MNKNNKYLLIVKYGLTPVSYLINKSPEWVVSKEEKNTIVEIVNSNFYFRYLVNEKYTKITQKDIKKLLRKRNTMAMKRVVSKEREKKRKLVMENLKNLRLYKDTDLKKI